MTYLHKHLPVFIQYKNNKHMYIRMKDTGCHITAPKSFSKQLIHQYVKNNEVRLIESYQKLKNISYTLLGNAFEISFRLGAFHYEIKNHHVFISHPISFDAGFKLFLNIEFQKYIVSIKDKIHLHIKKFGLNPVHIDTSYLKSKYGSYHRLKNKITLNSYLYMLDPELIEYVIMHEYAHTKEFHHQKSFYDLQHKLCLNDKELSKRLKTLTIPTHFTL
jgi:predicted metal-dependent hydrolase